MFVLEIMRGKEPENEAQYQPALGVKGDFERLLQRFTQSKTVRYEKFAEVWREMKFSLYCSGRDSDRECREFVEECFRIAVQFLLPPSTFQVRAGAVYLLYGLYHFQACRPKMKIRMTLEAWNDLMEFQALVHQQQHLDIDFILHKLRLAKAFIFTYHPGMLCPSLKDGKNDNSLPEMFKDEESLLDEVFTSQTLNQVALIHDQYTKMKAAFCGKGAEISDSSVNMINSDLVKVITKTISSHKNRSSNLAKENDEEEEEEDNDDQDASVKNRLKQKAFKTRHKDQRSTGREEKVSAKGKQLARKAKQPHVQFLYSDETEGTVDNPFDDEMESEAGPEEAEEAGPVEAEPEEMLEVEPNSKLHTGDANTSSQVLSMPNFDEPSRCESQTAHLTASASSNPKGKKGGNSSASGSPNKGLSRKRKVTSGRATVKKGSSQRKQTGRGTRKSSNDTENDETTLSAQQIIYAKMRKRKKLSRKSSK